MDSRTKATTPTLTNSKQEQVTTTTPPSSKGRRRTIRSLAEILTTSSTVNILQIRTTNPGRNPFLSTTTPPAFPRPHLALGTPTKEERTSLPCTTTIRSSPKRLLIPTLLIKVTPSLIPDKETTTTMERRRSFPRTVGMADTRGGLRPAEEEEELVDMLEDSILMWLDLRDRDMERTMISRVW